MLKNEFCSCKDNISLKLPLLSSIVPAGFPSPADDYIDRNLDLNTYLIKKPASTYFVKVSGNSMCDAGINSGDILIVDKSITPSSGMIIIAVINGELTVKRFIKKNGQIYLAPENPDFPIIKIEGSIVFESWGVVTYIIHKAI